jgi:hypothetical protein
VACKLTRSRAVSAAAAALVLALGAGCGAPKETRVVTVETVGRDDLARYQPGDPARALLELIRVVQSNDVSGTYALLSPAWKVTPRMLEGAMPVLSRLTRSFGLPRLLRTQRRGKRVSIFVEWGGQRGTFVLERSTGGWRLLRVVRNGRRVRIGGVLSP